MVSTDTNKGLKIAISGKGGVGKTTLSALLSYVFAKQGHRVLAVDADPDANLGSALGIPAETLSKITPIAEMKELIAERTGAKPGSMGGWFKLNPDVDDIPDKYRVEQEGVNLLVLGNIDSGGSGCICPESTLLKHLLRHLVTDTTDTVIVDFEAGLEHLGRGTAEAVDAFIVVVEPGQRSFQTAQAVAKMATEIGVPHVFAVGSKARPGDEAFIEKGIGEIPLLGVIPYDLQAVEADLQGEPPFKKSANLVAAAENIVQNLKIRMQK